MPFLDPDRILEVAQKFRDLSSPCRMCPRECMVDRLSGEIGYCGAGPLPSHSGILQHFGEEPPLVGIGGAGTIFFTHCNMRCVFCQNYQISRGECGEIMSIEELAQEMIKLQKYGASNIEPVSPTHQMNVFLEALGIAAQRGLDLPVVYNSGGYDSLEALKLLRGVVHVYMPDLKYADSKMSAKYSDCDDYVEVARQAIKEMYDQVGELELDADGRAIKGLIIRHLVLPNSISGSEQTMLWIRNNLSPKVTISLMSQYSPMYDAIKYPELNRRIKASEYNKIVDYCWDLGLENVFVQDIRSQDSCIPDFRNDKPFSWD
ncbi:MAG: radical SAM protein [Syntrophaceae bacterium]|nr:radical SAM protein [Syntrophaceae bacterium]